MYVYFRMLKVAVRAFFSPRARFLDPIRTEIRVWPNDLDFNFHLNNGRYLTLMDLGRFDLTIRTGLVRAVFSKGWLPVLATASIQFYRSIGPFQKFFLQTKIVHWDEKWVYLSQTFHCEGKVVASALVKAVFKHKKQTVPVRKLFEFVGEDFFVNDVPSDIAHLSALEEGLEGRRRERKPRGEA
jgi:acyl-CoA thioesterase FadM